MNSITKYFWDSPSSVFTLSDVTAAVCCSSEYSRQGLVKRAIANNEVLHLRRGLYCLAPKYQKKAVNSYALAERIYGPSYVSMESALRYHDWIPESVPVCTCAAFGKAREFDTPLGIFAYKRVPQQTFYLGVDRETDAAGNTFFMASPAKALVDYVYVNRPPWKSIDDAAASMRIEYEDFAAVPREEIMLLHKNYSNKRVQRFLWNWQKALT